METKKDLLKRAALTKGAPRVQDAHPNYEANLPKAESAMDLEEFMRRNPSARSKDKVKKAQEKQGKRASPKMRETARSLRGGKAVPARGRKTDLARRVELNIAGDTIEWLEWLEFRKD